MPSITASICSSVTIFSLLVQNLWNLQLLFFLLFLDLSRWRNNAKYMQLSQNVNIANYFTCSLDFLVGRSDNILDFQPQICPSLYPYFRELLKSKGITQNQTNIDTRIKSSHFVDWKNGSDPHILSLFGLANYLNITLDVLIRREKF